MPGAAALGAAELLGVPYRALTEPYYVGYRNLPYNQLLEERLRIAEAARAPTVTPDRQAAYAARLAELDRRLAEESQRMLNPLTFLREARATPEQVAEFERTAPWYEQMLAGALLDPLNVVSFGGGRLLEAIRLARGGRSLQPVAMSVDEAFSILGSDRLVEASAGALTSGTGK